MVTINHIAKMSGYSVSTVSRALSGSDLIPQSTREQIRKIADELGYIPNIAAKSLKTKRSQNIGIISFIDEKLGFSHYLFAGIFDSFVRTIENNNYDITLLSRRLLEDSYDLVGYCMARSLDGILILCADTSVKQIQMLLKSKIPIVVIDSFNDDIGTDIYFITSDNRVKMFELTDYVISLGHRNLVYITGHDIYVTRERVKGFQAALKVNDIPFEESMLVPSRYYNNEVFTETFNEVLARGSLPDCIFLPDDFSAISAYEVLKRRGLTIGEDIGLAGFDGLEITQRMSPQLTTIHQDVVKMGECAAQAMLDALNGIEQPFLRLIESTLIKGESVLRKAK